MRQRFNLFYTGFTASLPSLYFSKLNLKDTFSQNEDDHLQSVLTRYFQSLSDEKPEYDSHLISALNLTRTFDIDGFQIPETSSEYFTWLDELVNEFDDHFPMGRIEHYYFLYSRKIAELIKNMGLIKTYVDIQILTKQSIDLSKKIENCIKDSEFIVFKLMAPSALLSSEGRQTCFNSLYKEINEEILNFKGIDPKQLNESELLNLKSKADHFHVLLMNGFKNCIAQLKDF